MMKENFLSIDKMQKGSEVSDFFRKKLVEIGYHKFDGKPIKGEICYDAYYKDFGDEEGLNYTIYCYCYDLKGMVENPEIFEFAFEVQLNAGLGIIGMEAIQWDFRTIQDSILNVRYFEKKIEDVWEALGKIKFPK